MIIQTPLVTLSQKRGKMSNICWFQFIKCKDLMCFFVIHIVKEESLLYGQLIGHKKESENVTSQIPDWFSWPTYGAGSSGILFVRSEPRTGHSRSAKSELIEPERVQMWATVVLWRAGSGADMGQFCFIDKRPGAIMTYEGQKKVSGTITGIL